LKVAPMIKPGWQTTEFWLTILNTVLMALVGFNVLQQDAADNVAALAGPIIAAVLPIVVYIVGRSLVKRSA